MSAEELDRVLDDVLEGCRRGVRPDLESLCGEYPELAADLRRLVPSLMLMEGVKPDSECVLAWSITEDAPEQLGEYRILGKIGRGGMGVVYEAEQTSLGRRVALKMLPQSISRDATAVRRFEREARAAARLHHTNIVPVFEVGQFEDCIFYTMQLIQGTSLDAVLEQLGLLWRAPDNDEQSARFLGPSSLGRDAAKPQLAARITDSLMSDRFRTKNFVDSSTSHARIGDGDGDDVTASSNTAETERVDSVGQPTPTTVARLGDRYWRSVARIGLQVAEALAYSHAHGVVHRDMKPANLILGEDGVVWVTDFGLALTKDTDVTQTGDVLGTLRYLAPERFAGECTELSDVYSLGVTLYEFLVLRPAFGSSNRLRLIELIRNTQLVAPRKGDPRIPRDLETIVLKACEKEVAGRYASAQAMADDLQRFLDDQPIQARQISPFERLLRWSRRNAGLAGSLAAVLVLLSLLTIGSLVAANYYRSQRTILKALSQQREQEANRAIAAEQATQASLYQAHMRMAGDIMSEASGTDRVLELTGQWIPDDSGPDLRGWEWYFLRSLCHRERLSIDSHQHWLWSVAWSPEGTRLATCGGDTVKIWNSLSGELKQTLTYSEAEPVFACWSPDSSRLATAAGRDIVVWDVGAEAVVQRLPAAHQKAITQVAWSPDGSRLASSGLDGKVRVWELATGKQSCESERPEAILAVAWSPDSKYVAFTGPFQGIYVLESVTGKVLYVMSRHTSQVTSLSWSADGKRLASCGQDQTVKIWDAAQRRHLFSFLRPNRVQCVSWDPTSRLVAVGAWQGAVAIIDVDTQTKIHHLFGHEDRVWGIDWNQDGTQLASVSLAGELKVWDASVADEPRALVAGIRGFEQVAWSSDGTRLAASNEESIFVWDSLESQPRALAAYGRVLTALCWSPSGERLASASGADSARIWDVATGQVVLELNPGSTSDSAVAWSPDGRLIASANNGALSLHDADSGEVVRVLTEEPVAIESLSWSPDSRSLATARTDGEIELWDVNRGLALGQLSGHADAVTAVRWNWAGTRIASASRDRTVRVWDAHSRTMVKILRGHNRLVTSVCWHPSDTRLATGSEDGTVKIWDVASGAETLAMRLHRSNVTSVDWSSDGRRIASGSWDATVRIWDATRGYELSSAVEKPAPEVHLGASSVSEQGLDE